MNFFIKTILLIVLGFAIIALADGKKTEPKEIILPKIMIPAPKKESERKKIRATKQKNSSLIQTLKKQTEIAVRLHPVKQRNFA